jgi:hypothetical protein
MEEDYSFLEGFIHAFEGERRFWEHWDGVVNSGIYSAPGLRGFGLGGLGRPSMS